MTDPGLTTRLRQRSRRAGLAVGLSMAFTIAVCIGSFVWLYAKVDPYTSDFVGAEAEAPQQGERATSTQMQESRGSGEASNSDDPTAAPSEQTPTPEPTMTPTPDVFVATHLSNPELRVNLRPEPSVDTEPVAVLDAGTPLQFLGEQQTGADGYLWYRFRTEDGLVGWLREGTFIES